MKTHRKEELQIMSALHKAKTDIKAGRVKSHAQVEKLFVKWTSKWRGTTEGIRP
jgi:hypothetical protein